MFIFLSFYLSICKCLKVWIFIQSLINSGDVINGFDSSMLSTSLLLELQFGDLLGLVSEFQLSLASSTSSTS